MSDMREAKPGLWLPWKIEETLFTDPNTDHKDVWGKVAAEQILQVSLLEFDTLKDEFFDVEIPDGAYVMDQVRQLNYRKQPDGGDPFQKSIEAARDQPQKWPWHWILTLNALLASFVIVFFVIRRIMLKKRSPPPST